MQEGEIVQIGSGCPATKSGKHQCEDHCRVCGGVAGVADLQADKEWTEELIRLIEAQCNESFGFVPDPLKSHLAKRGDK